MAKINFWLRKNSHTHIPYVEHTVRIIIETHYICINPNLIIILDFDENRRKKTMAKFVKFSFIQTHILLKCQNKAKFNANDEKKAVKL